MKHFLLSICLIAPSIGTAQSLEDITQGQRPGAASPFYSKNDVPIINRIPSDASTGQDPTSFTPGIVQFEWSDEESETPQSPVDTPLSQTPVTPPPIVVPDTNLFLFEEPEIIDTPVVKQAPIAQVIQEDIRPLPNGPGIAVDEDISPDVIWVTNPTQNPMPFSLTVPEGMGDMVLVLGSDGLINWELEVTHKSSVKGILIIGPYAEHAQLRVSSINRVRAPVVRRKDLGPTNPELGLFGGLKPQPTAVIGHTVRAIYLTKSE